jgi:hypothetical protein
MPVIHDFIIIDMHNKVRRDEGIFAGMDMITAFRRLTKYAHDLEISQQIRIDKNNGPTSNE